MHNLLMILAKSRSESRTPVWSQPSTLGSLMSKTNFSLIKGHGIIYFLGDFLCYLVTYFPTFKGRFRRLLMENHSLDPLAMIDDK